MHTGKGQQKDSRGLGRAEKENPRIKRVGRKRERKRGSKKNRRRYH